MTLLFGAGVFMAPVLTIVFAELSYSAARATGPSTWRRSTPGAGTGPRLVDDSAQ